MCIRDRYRQEYCSGANKCKLYVELIQSVSVSISSLVAQCSAAFKARIIQVIESTAVELMLSKFEIEAWVSYLDRIDLASMLKLGPSGEQMVSSNLFFIAFAVKNLANCDEAK